MNSIIKKLFRNPLAGLLPGFGAAATTVDEMEFLLVLHDSHREPETRIRQGGRI